MRAVTQLLRVLIVSAVIGAGVMSVAPGLDRVAPAGAVETGAGVPVMGPIRLNATQLANWFRATGRRPALPVTIDEFASYYVEEGLKEGVRGDIAFAQSILETGYLGFVGSIVKPENFNYAGMGACDSCNSGRQFLSARVGVRAQIQHLKNFADPTSRAATLANPPVVEWYGRRSTGALDPVLAVYNYDHFFAKGTAPTWNLMGGPGKWASAPSYGTEVLKLYNRMLTFNGLNGGCPPDRLGFGVDEARDCPLSIRQAGRSVAPGAGGYYVLNGNGSVRTVGSAPSYGSPSFGWDIARDIAATPDGQGYVVLDGFGGVHLFGSAATGPLRSVRGPYFGFDIARSIVLTADGAGYYVLDGWGGIHRAGSAQQISGRGPYWPGWDIARSLAVSLDGKGAVLLDGFGGVWTFGTAARLRFSYFGFDVARDIVITPNGDGFAVLEAFGGIHRSGPVPVAHDIGYATFDRWRGLTLRNGGYTAVRNDGYSAS
ncbi:MAG: glucosaminidase domain-containing protein [Acidimicrobiia bacterium]|nr:glucosaminidase domain-containing protein [Acidimicrobiia bacterium]